MFGFYAKRKIFFALSLGIILVGLVTALLFGVKLDIQFKGGTILKYSCTGPVDLEALAAAAETVLDNPVSIQEITDFDTGEVIMVNLNVTGDRAISIDRQNALGEAFNEQFPDNGFKIAESFSVDPFIGREFLLKGLMAMGLSAVLIVLYVWVRFRRISGLSAGVMALVALFHDVIMVFVTFVIAGIPLNESLVAVVLTILGFSINDTIVIYDRIRENMDLQRGKMTLPELVDLSINQSITRSINTSLATLAAITVAYIFATINHIESIREFALPMMVGIISGSYSTIFIAGPLWVMWKTRAHRTGLEAAPQPATATAAAGNGDGKGSGTGNGKRKGRN